MTAARLIALALGIAAAPGLAQTPDPTAFAGSADIRAQVAALAATMKPGQTFAWAPALRAGVDVAGLEIWKAPGKPAVHPTQAEYAIVVDGEGTLVTGGTLVEAKVTNPGLTEGSRIAGGTTRALHPGDVFLVPPGTPHWFGVTGPRLVLLGLKSPTKP